jgi:DHA2 family multidrug resistance protein
MAHGLMTIQVSSQYLTTIRFFVGFAMPFLWVPLQMITLSGVPPEKMASATGLSNFVRMLSSSLATALGITLWDERAIVHRADLVERVSMAQYRDMLAASDRVSPAGTGGELELLELMISQQARTMAQQDVYIVGAGILLSLALLAGFLPKKLSSGKR